MKYTQLMRATNSKPITLIAFRCVGGCVCVCVLAHKPVISFDARAEIAALTHLHYNYVRYERMLAQMHISPLYLSVANPIPTQQQQKKTTTKRWAASAILPQRIYRVRACGKSCEFSVLNVRNYFVLCRLNRSIFFHHISYCELSDQKPKNCVWNFVS